MLCHLGEVSCRDRPQGVARKGGLDGYGWPESSPVPYYSLLWASASPSVPYYSLWAGPKVAAGLPQPVRPACSRGCSDSGSRKYPPRKVHSKRLTNNLGIENVYFKTKRTSLLAQMRLIRSSGSGYCNCGAPLGPNLGPVRYELLSAVNVQQLPIDMLLCVKTGE